MNCNVEKLLSADKETKTDAEAMRLQSGRIRSALARQMAKSREKGDSVTGRDQKHKTVQHNNKKLTNPLR